MSQAHKRLLSSLTDVINGWVNEECDADDWNNVVEYLGNDTSSFMADAAFAVLLATAESQRYAVKQGYLKEDNGQ